MTVAGTDWRKLAGQVFAPLRFVDREWLPMAARHSRSILATASKCTVAAKVLRRYLPDESVSAPIGPDALKTAPSWATWPAAAQRHLVRRLGTIACAPYLRLLVSKPELDKVRGSIDPDSHREALSMHAGLVYTDIRAEFEEALSADELAPFIATVGIAILRQTVPDRHRFLLFRLKYLFPRAAWRPSFPELTCNSELLLALLNTGDGVE